MKLDTLIEGYQSLCERKMHVNCMHQMRYTPWSTYNDIRLKLTQFKSPSNIRLQKALPQGRKMTNIEPYASNQVMFQY